MALRGNLKDFSLPDVFQLVTFSRKTGVLRIRRGDDAEGSVWFRDGDVFFAQSNWHREPLGERLVTAGKITPNALTRALDLQKTEPQGGRRLGEILVDEGYITDKVLEAFVQEQVQDTIFDLMRWDEGEFDFELLPEIVDEDIGLSVSIENVIMEGSRRLEEWNRIKKKVPSMGIVFKMATAPGEGTFEISLKPAEWNLLLLVDGTRSIAELARETSRTDFEVARIVYGLFSAGLLEVAGDDEVERLRAERAEREARHAAIRREMDAGSAAEAPIAAAPTPAAPPQAPQAPQAPQEPAPAPAAAAAPAPVAPAPVAPAAEEGHVPAEEPAFLYADTRSPSAEDMAVFDLMMGVLQSPEAQAAAPAAPPSAVPEQVLEAPVVEAPTFEPPTAAPAPAEMPLPEAVSAPEPAPSSAPEAAADVPIPTYDETFGLAGPPPPPPTAEEVAPAVVPEAALEYASAATEEPIGPAVVEAPAPIEPLEPVRVPEPMPPARDVPPVQDLEEPAIAEPMSSLGAAAPAVSGDFESDLRSLGLGERPPVAEPAPRPVEEMTIAQIEAMSRGETIAPVEPAAPAGEAVSESADEAVADLSGLLSSLDEEPAVDEAEAPSGGVISTDAYLADITVSEDSFGGLVGGLNDEITALTGGGNAKGRPSASVNRIPEREEIEMVLRRDQMVDKELLMKIIDGIKEL